MNEKFVSFEDAFDNLKTIVKKFEDNNNLKLDDLVKNYEEGILAYNFCLSKLVDAEKRIIYIDNMYKD